VTMMNSSFRPPTLPSGNVSKDGGLGEDDEFEFQAAATPCAEERAPSRDVESKKAFDEDDEFNFQVAAPTCDTASAPCAAESTPSRSEGGFATGGSSSSSSSSSTILQVDACLRRIGQVFSMALQHSGPKPAQTAVSSMQNLAQNPTCTILAPVIVPCLLSSLVNPASRIPESSLQNAWGVVSAMATTQQGSMDATFIGVTIHMMLVVVLSALKSERSASYIRTHKHAMAQCLVQLTNADKAAMKTEVSALPVESQQAIGQLLREHMSAASLGGSSSQGAGATAAVPEKKIELKMKF